jgi:predicted metallo-beta-lactamase superfamily hydrolase
MKEAARKADVFTVSHNNDDHNHPDALSIYEGKLALLKASKFRNYRPDD